MPPQSSGHLKKGRVVQAFERIGQLLSSLRRFQLPEIEKNGIKVRLIFNRKARKKVDLRGIDECEEVYGDARQLHGQLLFPLFGFHDSFLEPKKGNWRISKLKKLENYR